MTAQSLRAALRALLLASCGALFVCPAAPALGQTNYYWDPLLHASADGGTGTWDNTTMNWQAPTINGGLTNWSPGVSNDSIANIAANSANSSDTISLGANISANVLNFSTTKTYTYTVKPATSTTNSLTFVGANPTINLADNGGAITAAFTANVIATSQLHIIDTDTTGTLVPIVNFNGSGDSFAGGLYIDAPTRSPAFNPAFPINGSTTAQPSSVMRVNFNTDTAPGVGAGAGNITVAANGVRFSNANTASGAHITFNNHIILNPGGTNTAAHPFWIAMGGTNAQSGNQNLLEFAGDISGNADILIGNDVTYASGGAGITLFSGTRKTYTGKTIVNNSANTGNSPNLAAVMRMGADNVLPDGNILQFGNIPTGYTGSGVSSASNVGAFDLNNHTETVAALVSTPMNSGAVISGVTNTGSSIGTLVINGSTTDSYSGYIGQGVWNIVTQSGGTGTPSTKNVAITRDGIGTTTLGGSNGVSNYIGDTKVIGGSTLVAGATTGFSPNSNFIVSGTAGVGAGIASVDLNGFNSTINSLASLSGNTAGVVTNNSLLSNATLTIGSNSSLNANPAPTTTFSGLITDGLGGKTLALTKAGGGTQILAAPNTYSGGTVISGGSLRLTNSTGSATGSGPVTVNSGGTLSGTGIATGDLTINSSGTIAPGTPTAVGNLTVGNTTLMSGGNYAWKISDATAAAGTGYDTVTSTGALTLDGGLATTPFSVTLNSLGVVPAHFNPSATGQNWTLATFASQSGTFDPSEFNVIATGFKGGNLFSTFNVSNPSAGVLQLNYVPGTAPANLTWVGPTGSGGGSGSWDPSGGASWNDGVSNTGWSASKAADFNAGSGTVTLSNSLSAPLITFDVDGYTIAGASNLSATNGYTALTVQVTNAGTTGTINAPIVSPLNVIGSGTLVLGGANNFGGGGVSVAGGATLRGSVGSLGGSGGTSSSTAISNSGTVVIDQTGTATYSGAMSGGGSLVKQGAGTLILTGNSSYSGGTTVSAGTLRVANDASLGAAGGTLTFNGGTLNLQGVITARPLLVKAVPGNVLDDSGAGVVLNLFSGGASFDAGAVLTKTGPGNLQITTNPWLGNGGIVVNQGSLIVGDQNDPASNPSTFLGGNGLTLNGGAVLTIVAASSPGASITPPTIALNGNVMIALYKTGGAGGLACSLGSTTTISGGIITVGRSGLDSNNGLLQSSTMAFGPTTFNGDTTIQTIASGSAGAATGVSFGVVADNGHTTTFLGQGNASQGYGPGAGVTFSGAPADGNSTQSGNWIIGDAQGANSQIVSLNVPHAPTTGQLALTTGSILVNPGSQLGIGTISSGVYGPSTGSQTITLNGTGPVDPAKPGQFLGAFFVGQQAEPVFGPTINVVLASDTLFNLGKSNATFPTTIIFNGPMTGSGNLTLQAADTEGRMTLAGNNNLTGSTTVTGGKLQVNLGSSMGTGDLTLAQANSQNTDVILNNTAQTVGNLRSLYAGSANGPVFQEIHLHGTALSITQTVAADYGIDPSDGATPSGSDSTISGTGSVILSSASTAELSLSDPNNSYSGSTTINGGSLAISTDTNLGSAPANSAPGQLTVNGGQLHIKNNTPVSLAATRGFAVGPNGGTLRTDTGAPLTIPGVTTFSNAAHTLTISPNSYVKLSPSANATAVASGSSVTVSAGATLELSGTASALSDGGSGHVNVVNNSQASGGGLLSSGTDQNAGFVSGSGDTVVADGSDLTISGIIQDSLVISGSLDNEGKLTIRASDSGSGMMAAETPGNVSLTGSLARSSPLSPAGLVDGLGASELGAHFGGLSAGGLNLGGGIASVPEPGTWLLAAVGLAGIAIVIGSRRRPVAPRAA